MDRKAWIAVLGIAGMASTARAQSVLVQIEGATTLDRLGTSIAALSDLDGDGVPELAVGALSDKSVYVVSGATGATLYSIPSHHYADGKRVRAVGDCDGDGKIDFVVPNWEENGNDGVVRVYSGANGAVLHTFVGTGSARLGRDADGVGDVDGDKRSDFVIGADGEGGNGVARVQSGATGAVIHTVSASVYGGLVFGAGVAGVGDVDGDVVPDFAVGVPAGAGAGGTVFVFSGSDASLLLTINEPSLSNWTYGRTIASPGDVTGDGLSDIAVGDTHVAGYTGSVYVYSGADGSLLYQLFGEGCAGDGSGGANPSFGTEMAAVGDLDGDGVGDLAVGGMNEARVFSGASGALLRDFREPEYLAPWGSTSVSSVPDLDGDGLREMVVGWMWSPGDPKYHQHNGRVTWYADDVYPPAGTLLALGDGSGLACPCGNTGQAQAGCANSTGLGGELRGFGSTSLAQSTLYVEASHLPPNVFALLYSGTTAIGGGLGMKLGDGLRGAGGLTKRFHLWRACPDGAFRCGPGLDAVEGWVAGDTRILQAWYRDPNGPCGKTFNFTNAVQVTLTP